MPINENLYFLAPWTRWMYVSDGTSEACKLLNFVALSPVNFISTRHQSWYETWSHLNLLRTENQVLSLEFSSLEFLRHSNNYMYIFLKHIWKRHLRFWHKCYKFHSVNQLTLIQPTAVACYSLIAFPATRREAQWSTGIFINFKVFGNVAKHRLQCLTKANTITIMISFLQNWVKMT